MIRDKNILIKNIYYMFAYAFRELKQDTMKKVSIEKFDNIHELFAKLFIEGLRKQVKQGLYREYIPYRDDVNGLKGKMNLSKTMQHRINQRQLIHCEYDDLSENNILNIIIKTTATILIKQAEVDQHIKEDLKKYMLFFTQIDIISPRDIKWSSINLHRNNQSYRLLLNLCQLILDGMLLTTDTGKYKLTSFINEQKMCRLFEKFVLAYYKKHFPYLYVNSSQISWNIEDNINNLLPRMQTDITVESKDKVLIIDTKYYQQILQQRYMKQSISSQNLYQIFTYVKNKAVNEPEKEVSGLLLYAKTDKEMDIDSSYKMSGNLIMVKTLDLNCSFDEIKTQLNSIIMNYFGG